MSLVKRLLAHDRLALAKAITLEDEPTIDRLMEELRQQQSNTCLRVGITGAPGVGKSCFIEALGQHICKSNQPLACAVLAIDPSSPETGGSLLGDKTRMPKLANLPKPTPARANLGGLASGTGNVLSLLEAVGVANCLVETVGVGQAEMAVRDFCDVTVLLVAPGGGDDLQAMKRGITEVVKLIIVNKVDHPDDPAGQLTAAHYRQSGRPVMIVSSHTGRGIPEAWERIREMTGDVGERRRQQQRKQLEDMTMRLLTARFHKFMELQKTSYPSYGEARRLLAEFVKDAENGKL